MCEQVPYSVFGAECYFEVCLSKYVCDVGGFLTYIGEAGPLFLRCLSDLFVPWGVDRWVSGCDGKGIVVENVVDSVQLLSVFFLL
jgi:hypothetical protein